MNKNLNDNKNHLPIIIDSSSLIYLKSANILDIFLQNINTVSTKKVREEISVKDNSLEMNFLSGLIQIVSPVNVKIFNKSMSLTDREILEIALVKGYVVLSDDGKISRYCDENGLPHINSLTAIVLLFEKDILDLNETYDYLNKVIEIGRYSKDIVKFAFSLLP